MSPSFEDLAKDSFDRIKTTLGTDKDEILYRSKSGGSFKIFGIFDDQVQEVDPDTERVISSNAYSFGMKLDDIKPKTPQKGDTITFKKKLYKVIESREDGVPGVSTVLILHRVDKVES